LYLTTKKIRPEYEIIENGNDMAHDANVVADAAMWKFQKAYLGSLLTLADFFDIYFVSADEAWENRDFHEFVVITNRKADMASWKNRKLIDESVFKSFDLLHKKVMATLTDHEGVFDKEGFKRDANYERLEDEFHKAYVSFPASDAGKRPRVW
jgi:hypothetical protein